MNRPLHVRRLGRVPYGEAWALQRALEHWQPRFLEWWGALGPEGFQAAEVYLRTATSVDAKGWATFGYVRMPEYRWGIFLADREADRTVGFGRHHRSRGNLRCSRDAPLFGIGNDNGLDQLGVIVQEGSGQPIAGGGVEVFLDGVRPVAEYCNDRFPRCLDGLVASLFGAAPCSAVPRQPS